MTMQVTQEGRRLGVRYTIDLQEVAMLLRQRLGPQQLRGYVRGKTMMRDVAMSDLALSSLRAERLIDELANRGFCVFVHDHTGGAGAPGRWQIDIEPLWLS